MTACCPGNVHALQPVRVCRARWQRACADAGAGAARMELGSRRGGAHTTGEPLPIALLHVGLWRCWTGHLYLLSTRPALQVGTRATTQTPCNNLISPCGDGSRV